MKKISLYFIKVRTYFLVFINVFLASFFNIIEKPSKALHYINKAIDYHNSIKDSLKPEEALDDSLYSMKTDILKDLGEYDKALICINKAIEINPNQ